MFLTFRAMENRIQEIGFGFVQFDAEKGSVRSLNNFYERWMKEIGKLPVESWSYPPQVARGDAAVVTYSPRERPANTNAGYLLVVRVGPGAEIRWVTEVYVEDIRFPFLGGRLLSLMSPDGWIALRGGWVDPDGKWHADPLLNESVVGLMADRSIVQFGENGLLLFPSGSKEQSAALVSTNRTGYVHLFHIEDFMVGLGNPEGRSPKDWMKLVVLDPKTGKLECLFDLVFWRALRWTPDGAWAQTVVRGDGFSEFVRIGLGQNVLLEYRDTQNPLGLKAYPLAIASVTETSWLVVLPDRILRVHREGGEVQAEVVLNIPLVFRQTVPGGLLNENLSRGQWVIVPEWETHRDDLSGTIQSGSVFRVLDFDRIAAILVDDSIPGKPLRSRLVLWPGLQDFEYFTPIQPAVAVSGNLVGIARAVAPGERTWRIHVHVIELGGKTLFNWSMEMSGPMPELQVVALQDGGFEFQIQNVDRLVRILRIGADGTSFEEIILRSI